MSLQIVTGYAGKAHITAADDGAMQAGMIGTGKYVLNVGNKFAYTIVSNNSITIKDGSLMDQGRHINIPYGETVSATITNGTQSKYRKDIIGIQYTKNTTTGIETVSLVVKKGTEAASESAAKDPSYDTGNILQGATSDFFPLYRVTLNGLSISSVTALFNVLVSMDELNTNLLDKSIYDYIEIQSRTIKSNGSNYLLVESFGETQEFENNISKITKGSAAITIKKPGNYIVLLRVSITSSSPSLSISIERKTSTDNSYVQYRTIADYKITGMTSSFSIMNIPEENCNIAFNVTNYTSVDATIGSGTSLIIVPLF